MGSSASLSLEGDAEIPPSARDMDEKKRLILKGTTRFFELDWKREGYLDVPTISILADDILQEYNTDALVSKEEVKKRILHKINTTSVEKMVSTDSIFDFSI